MRSFSYRYVRYPHYVRFEQEFMLILTGLRREVRRREAAGRFD